MNNPYFDLGLKHFENYEFDKALLYFKDSLRVYPNDHLALQYIGDIYLFSGDVKNAFEVLSKYIQICPDNPTSYIGLGFCYMQDREDEKALECYEYAIQLDPNCEVAFFSIAQFYFIVKLNSKAAIPYLLKATSLNPDFIEALAMLGNCYADLGEVHNARSVLKTALMSNPHNALLMEAVGNVFLLQGLYKEAKGALQNATFLNDEMYLSYLGLSKIPPKYFEPGELCGLPYFLKFIANIGNIRARFNLNEVVERCMSENLPLLFLELFKIDNRVLVIPDLLEKKIQNFSGVITTYRTISLLSNELYPDSHSNTIADALLSYYLGNPIGTYAILSNKLKDWENSEFNTLIAYYRTIAAFDMLNYKEEDFFMSVSVPIAHKVLKDPNTSNRAKYYASLIIELTGDFNAAISFLQDLVKKGFLPANYKIAELFYQRKGYEESCKQIQHLSMLHYNSNSYFTNPKKIIVSIYSETLTPDLFDLIHFIENDIILKIIKAYPGTALEKEQCQRYAQGVFFSKYIEIDKKSLGHYKMLLKQKSYEKYSRVYGTVEEERRLEVELKNCIQKDKNGIDFFFDISASIYQSCYQNIGHIKNKSIYPSNITNFRYYLRLCRSLKDHGLLDERKFVLLYEYILYSAQIVFFSAPQNEFIRFGLEECKNISIQESANIVNSVFPAVLKFISQTVPSALISFFPITTPINFGITIYKHFTKNSDGYKPIDEFEKILFKFE